MLYNGAFLEFKITSSATVNDAVIVLRLTPEIVDMIFTDNEYQVLVNGTKLNYGSLSLTGAYEQNGKDENGNTLSGESNKRPFENYELAVKVTLVKGENTIRLVTNNNRDHGGTFNAETPLVDCIYIYSFSELDWAECHPENVGKSQDEVEVVG